MMHISEAAHFSIHNIPFGIFSRANERPRVGSRYLENVVDLAQLARGGLFDMIFGSAKEAELVFDSTSLNLFMERGKQTWRAVREAIQRWLQADDQNSDRNRILIPANMVQMHLPIVIGDYTDFYASKEHASNVGTMLRGPENALMPNWLHLPVGYHGRASSVVVSGTPITRPCGQIKADPNNPPTFKPSQKLDFELEMGFIIGVGNELGCPIPIEKARDHIFGVVLMNDWSARDIQAWEYVPLGPFLAKSFGTTISPWVVTLDALEPFLVPGPIQDPEPLDYLRPPKSMNNTTYDVALEISVQDTIVATTNLKHLYWSFQQMLAHHTINGCNMRTGDLCGTGTISGPTKDSCGSMMELSWNGKNPITVGSEQRTFLCDGDSVVIRGCCCRGDVVVGFGECAGTIKPAKI